jgi:2-phospho-L-lactate guanylyltransferase
MRGVPVIALVPVKRLAEAKTRLASALEPRARRALMRGLVEHVLGELAQVSELEEVRVVTSDAEVVALAGRCGVGFVSDAGLPWNEGLVHALAQLRPAPAAVAFVSADLPLLRARDVSTLLAEAPPRGAAIARARDGGTNALVLRPPDVLAPGFGAAGSAAVHAERARAGGNEARIVDVPGLALDLDTPDDARDCLEGHAGGKPVELLRRLWGAGTPGAI